MLLGVLKNNSDLQHNPMHVYLEVTDIEFNGAHSQKSLFTQRNSPTVFNVLIFRQMCIGLQPKFVSM